MLYNNRKINIDKIFFIIIFHVLVFINIRLSSESADISKIDDSTSNNARTGWFALPVLEYSPETKLAAGAVFRYYFIDSDSVSRNTNYKLKFVYTMRNQIILTFFPDIFFDDKNYRLTGEINFTKYPYLFYGIGNNTLEENEERLLCA